VTGVGQRSTVIRELADMLDPPTLRWQRDPVGWATRAHDLELWSKQREIIESVRDHKATSVRSCHEVGKSWSAGLVAAWWLDTHVPGEAFVLTTAPTDKQVKAILWREINRLHSRLGLRGRTNLSEWYIGNELVAFGRKPNDYDATAFQGIHAKFILIILDEACGIPAALWDAASTLGANEHARFLAIGNPDDEHSEFAATTKSPDWHCIRIPYWDTPNFTGEPVSQSLKDLLIHPSWVEERRRKWGQGSALFTSKCEGEFPHGTSPFVVVPISWAETCRQLELPPSVPIEAGVDVGGGGDRTVVRIRYGAKAGPSYQFIDPDPMKTVGFIVLKLVEHGVTKVKVDSTGIGWGVAGALKETSSKHNATIPLGGLIHDAEIIPVNFGEGPTPGTEHLYLNKRAELWWTMRERVRLRLCDLETVDDDALQELTTPLYEILDSRGKIKIQPKDEVIKVLGRSPDEADALVLAYHEVVSEGALGATDLLADVDLTRLVEPADWTLTAPNWHEEDLTRVRM
jgi:hypothetical protein